MAIVLKVGICLLFVLAKGYELYIPAMGLDSLALAEKT